MAIFTFSTKGSRPADEATVRRVKEHCSNKGYNFSAVIIEQLRQWEKEQEIKNGRK